MRSPEFSAKYDSMPDPCKEIPGMMGEGYSDKEIADRMHLSRRSGHRQ